MQCKIKIIKEILGLWPECRPEVGKVYDAKYVKPMTSGTAKARGVAIIDLAGKKILIRRNEFEIVEAGDGV